MEVDLELHPSGIVPQLQNVVCTVNLGCKLDLKEIALHARNAEYNPKRFAAVIMRIREPKTTALIFASGKMVVTGAKSEEDSRSAARKYAKVISKLGFGASWSEFKIQNIVGSCDVKFPIRLEGISLAYHDTFARYEPELFPGLIWRMAMPKVVLLIFVSGKVVLTGAKQRLDIYKAFENIYPILQTYRKGAAAAAAAPVLALPDAAGVAEIDDVEVVEEPDALDAMGPPSPRRLPPPTPTHHSLPPPTPAHPGLHAHVSHMDLPPPTPMHHMV